MIRAVAAIFAFALALSAWIVVRPFDRDDRAGLAPAVAVDLADVSRGIATLDPLQAEAAGAAGVIIDRAPDALDRLTAEVLSGFGLGQPGIGADGAIARMGDPMAALSSEIAASIRAATGQPPTGVMPDSLGGIVLDALRDGRPDSEVAALVAAAAAVGPLKVPEALVSTSGSIDVGTLLAHVLMTAQRLGGNPASVPVPPATAVEGVEVRTLARDNGTTETFRVYTVRPGDSLAGVALRFYGTAEGWDLILMANPAILGAPDRISEGQRIVIPDP